MLKGATQNLPGPICCGAWTPDQKYLIFSSAQDNRSDLWVVRDQTSFLSKPPVPTRLTNGPLSYDYFVPSRDGKQIFAIGTQKRGELVRFDSRVHDYVPFLGGISALDPVFSRDGQWVSYITYPEQTLWRSRADGGDRLQLTYPPVVVAFARMSPDGKTVAFSDDKGDAYLVSANGGTPQKLAAEASAPDWSPDGNFLAVTWLLPKKTPSSPSYVVKVIDVRTGQISTIPGSEGRAGPWYISPDSIVAMTEDQVKFQEFNFKTQKWTDIITSPGNFTNWETSADLKYFFFGTGGNDPKIFRMRLAGRTIEEISSVKNFAALVDNPALSVSPDDSAVLTRNTGSEEVYALTVRWP